MIKSEVKLGYLESPVNVGASLTCGLERRVFCFDFIIETTL